MALEGSNLHHNVYVVELSKDVLDIKKFMDRNPQHITNKCVYVGMTGLTPIERFKKHKAGLKSNIYVERYGVRLLPNLYEKYNPMTFDEALKAEKELAKELQSKGYGVWCA